MVRGTAVSVLMTILLLTFPAWAGETAQETSGTDPSSEEINGTDEEPADEEPAGEEAPAHDEEPVDEEPVDEEPVDKEPVDEEPVETPKGLDLPDDPAERLVMARRAFRATDYDLLVPLLQPIAGPDTPFADVDDRVAAREFLAVGYFFLAQQVTQRPERDALLDQAKRVFLDLLRDKPDHSLDTLIFPASVVELYEVVRRENAEELERLLDEQNASHHGGDVETLYIERAATQHVWWINLLPFGAGQFQNDQYAKATAFAILQGAALALNGVSYYVILSLRNENGRYDATDGVNSPFATALRWRQVLYGGLAGFAGLWILSAIDGLINFEHETVRIRTLDAPPPELGGALSDTGHGFRLPLGLAVELRW